MDIVLVTPEIAPYARFSHVGDAFAALPKALRGLGHKVTVIAPLWPSIDPAARHLARRLTRLNVEIDGQDRAFALFEGRSAGGVDLHFLSEESLFVAGAETDESSPAAARRFGAFCRAAQQLIARRDTAPDVVHLVGWQTAPLALLFAQSEGPRIPTVLSVHDVTAQGLFDREAMAEFGIPSRLFTIDGVEFFGRFSALKAGIQFATIVTTPSPMFATEIREKAGGLEGVLSARGEDLSGVLHGVDAAVWNAATDPHLESRFDPMEVGGNGRIGKLRCKSAFQRELELPVRDDVALIAAIGPVEPGNALALAIESLPRIVRNDVQIVLLCEGEGDAELLEQAEEAAGRWADRIAIISSADAPLLHRAYGAADAVIVPSLGGGWAGEAMQAQRYGAMPIGRGVGAFADAVVDCDAKLSSGTGFVFQAPTADALTATLGRVVAAYANRPSFRALAQRAMMMDHSWERAGRLSERLYRAARTKAAPPAVSVDAAPAS